MKQSISAWLNGLGPGQYAHEFGVNAVDWEVLPELTDGDIRELGVSALGHRKKLLKAIRAAFNQSSPPSASPVAETESDTEAQRRQLTVMFCDLADSTELSARVDPEDFADIVRNYQAAATQVIEKYRGYVARFMGDGILVYFGYPRAHENDAERALRAGLGIIEDVANLHFSPSLAMQVRIGVATSSVVVGETIGSGSSREQVALGETPNLSARLQALAEPNTLVIGPATYQLVGKALSVRVWGARCEGLRQHVTGVACYGRRGQRSAICAAESWRHGRTRTRSGSVARTLASRAGNHWPGNSHLRRSGDRKVPHCGNCARHHRARHPDTFHLSLLPV